MRGGRPPNLPEPLPWDAPNASDRIPRAGDQIQSHPIPNQIRSDQIRSNQIPPPINPNPTPTQPQPTRTTMQDQAWDVASSEEASGARLSFHCWPSSRLEATRCVAPVGALYSPLRKLPAACAPPTALQYDPIRCATPTCKAVLNPY